MKSVDDPKAKITEVSIDDIGNDPFWFTSTCALFAIAEGELFFSI